mmetsp:Transcript_132984/g.384569  ORF Transcript_132984/g.384569 Transcript_132984/m.384569 type:complete len:295 (+) Transcript_132984:947-1831(+)
MGPWRLAKDQARRLAADGGPGEPVARVREVLRPSLARGARAEWRAAWEPLPRHREDVDQEVHGRAHGHLRHPDDVAQPLHCGVGRALGEVLRLVAGRAERPPRRSSLLDYPIDYGHPHLFRGAGAEHGLDVDEPTHRAEARPARDRRLVGGHLREGAAAAVEPLAARELRRPLASERRWHAEDGGGTASGHDAVDRLRHLPELAGFVLSGVLGWQQLHCLHCSLDYAVDALGPGDPRRCRRRHVRALRAGRYRWEARGHLRADRGHHRPPRAGGQRDVGWHPSCEVLRLGGGHG